MNLKKISSKSNKIEWKKTKSINDTDLFDGFVNGISTFKAEVNRSQLEVKISSNFMKSQLYKFETQEDFLKFLVQKGFKQIDPFIEQENDITLIHPDTSNKLVISLKPIQDKPLYYIFYKIVDKNGKELLNKKYIGSNKISEFTLLVAKQIIEKLKNSAMQDKGYTITANSSTKLKKISDYGQYFTGEIPEYNSSYIGSSSVDVSSILRYFSDAEKSVKIVNDFNPNLLRNIMYMFSFSNPSAYGVYIPALDADAKKKALSQILTQKGYMIVEENQELFAYPQNEEKTQEQIKQDIENAYQGLQRLGGIVIGVNPVKALQEADSSFENLKSLVSQDKLLEFRNDLRIAHVASIMAHEAVHAHGDTGESGPESVELALLNNEMNKIKSKYGIEQDLITKRQSSTNWYKFAQNYFPTHLSPNGSDLSGRMGGYTGDLRHPVGWGMSSGTKSLEQMLGRQFQSSLPSDLSPENDIIELQLRKYTRDDMHLDPKLIYDELLGEGRLEDDTAYKTTEELLSETRPSPLMKTLKSASLTKTAFSFWSWKGHETLYGIQESQGWYSNLGVGNVAIDYSDGQPDLEEQEEWNRNQPRYNPNEYTAKGFWYEWVEPRDRPTLFDATNRDYGTNSPAKRFASNDDLDQVKIILNIIKYQLLSKYLKCSRILCSEDLIDFISDFLGDDFNFCVFEVTDEEGLYSFWISINDMSNEIHKVETAIQGNSPKWKSLFDDLTGYKETIKKSFVKIFEESHNICKEYDIENIYIIGASVREMFVSKMKDVDINEVEFTGDNSSNNLKFGYILSKKLNVTPKMIGKNLVFTYRGVVCRFNGGDENQKIVQLMQDNDFDSSSLIMRDVANKDFTINSLIYHPVSKTMTKLFDDSEIKTIFDPNIIVKMNPLIILRAIYLSIRCDLKINKDLHNAMIKNLNLLNNISKDALRDAKIEIFDLDKKEAINLFEKYNLLKIFNMEL